MSIHILQCCGVSPALGLVLGLPFPEVSTEWLTLRARRDLLLLCLRGAEATPMYQVDGRLFSGPGIPSTSPSLCGFPPARRVWG